MTDLLWLYWLLVAVMVFGIIGAVIPTIPGISLIVGAIFVWGLVKGFGSVATALAVSVVLLLLSVAIDFLATYYGAVKAGASKWGQIGALVGLVVGLLGLLPALPVGGPLFGIILGPLLGAMIGELVYRRDLILATKAAIGIFVGSIVGNLVQGLFAIFSVLIFLWTTWPFRA